MPGALSKAGPKLVPLAQVPHAYITVSVEALHLDDQNVAYAGSASGLNDLLYAILLFTQQEALQGSIV